MRGSFYEKLWLAAALGFMAYPLGDVLGFWDIDAPIVLLCSIVLLLAGWNVGKNAKGRA